jgi:hypothetical protein
MKVIGGMLAAVLLSVYTLLATCWYAASSFFQTLIPVFAIAFIGYLFFVYVLYKTY